MCTKLFVKFTSPHHLIGHTLGGPIAIHIMQSALCPYHYDAACATSWFFLPQSIQISHMTSPALRLIVCHHYPNDDGKMFRLHVPQPLRAHNSLHSISCPLLETGSPLFSNAHPMQRCQARGPSCDQRLWDSWFGHRMHGKHATW